MQQYDNALDALETMISDITMKRENALGLVEKTTLDSAKKDLIEIRRRLLLIRFDIEDCYA